MAAIVDEKGQLDVNKLGDSLSRSLPAYARPLFVRFIPKADTTGRLGVCLAQNLSYFTWF